jgi:hypothetical protein
MKRIIPVIMVCLICLTGLGVAAAAQGEVTVNPAAVTATLPPGETKTIQVTVYLPGSVPKGDVVFVFDTTGSLYQVLDSMKSLGAEVMTQIRAAIPDTRFGVGSFMDYPQTYDNYYGYVCGGGPCMYGHAPSGDYAFRVDLNLTPDILTAADAIGQISPGSGGDGPQDYTRAIYESQFYNWSPEAQKIVIMFGDAEAHAAPNGTSLRKPWEEGYVFSQLVYGAPYGGDPGRDEIPYTTDDLDYELVLRDVTSRNINIVAVYCPEGGRLDEAHADAINNFKYMSYVTNGSFVLSDAAGDPAAITGQVVTIIQAMATQNVRELSIQAAEESYRGWVSSPAVLTDVPWQSSQDFTVGITPPAGTADGDYSFHLNVVGDGVVLGTVAVTIHVSGGQVVDPAKVSLDIKPGSCPNSFNPGEKGVLPMAILGSRDVKASLIDPKSLVLSRDGVAGKVKPLRWSLEDIGSPLATTCSCGVKSGWPDCKKDLSLKFDAQDVVRQLGIKKGDGCVKLTITGTLKSSDPKVNGRVITGSDYLRVLDTGNGSCGGKDGKGSCDDKGGTCGGKDGKDDKGSWDDKGSGEGKGSCGEKGSCDSNGGDSSKGNGPQDDDHSKGR